MPRPSPLAELTRTRTLVILSDVHIGSSAHCSKEFGEALRWCREHEALIHLNGDILENAVAEGSIAGEMLLEQIDSPTGQFKEAVSLLKPFARKGRVVGATRGNHESRTRRKSMLDLSEILAHALDVPYFGIGGIFRFKAGKQVYQLAIHHGKSNARANKFLENRRMAERYPRADLWALGHNHAFAAQREGRVELDSRGCEVAVERWWVRTGSYFDAMRSDYVTEAVLTPGAIGSPIIRFAADKHSIDVDTQTLRWLP